MSPSRPVSMAIPAPLSPAEPSASIPDQMLETLIMAPLPSSSLRLMLYLLRRMCGSDAQGRAISTVLVQTRVVARVLGVSASSVHEALERLQQLGVIRLTPGTGFVFGVSLNGDPAAWGRGSAGWGKLDARRVFESMLGSFSPEGDTVTPRGGSGGRPTINRKRQRRPHHA